ncbi:tetratricopeptide repeat protein [Mesoflavibacter zeaxanthinifaciens]|uniref:tetratricopeptide repeat protein n=1 Tax=Mesoflavibacter zeaxanthinifaciens TaxID=393060 RepID=UPI0026EEDC4B|nr:tetratricopeptide repeat protein [Mesoflavibacter zeaxanthinifaciens]
MKNVLTYILLLISVSLVAQDKDQEKALLKQTNKALSYVADANDFAKSDDFVNAEMEYRKALSTKPSQSVGAYNLAYQYYQKGSLDEALYRNQQAAKHATDKVEKHRAFHNIGNILMKQEKCKEAVEAYKNALRNNPKDDETRYNLGLAKDCAKNQQDDEPQEDDKDGENNRDKDENQNEDQKENNEKQQEDQDQKDQKDQVDQDKKEGDQDQDGNPKDNKDQDQKEGDQDNKQQQPQQGQLSPQQIKNLLEAMNNQEQKVQEKINAQKVKGAKVQTDKDW